MDKQPQYQGLDELKHELAELHPTIQASLAAGNKDKLRLMQLRNAVTTALELMRCRSYEAARVALEGVEQC